MYVMLRNILKTAIADTLATQFSWNGKKNKRCFKDLGVTKLIKRKYFIIVFCYLQSIYTFYILCREVCAHTI